MLQGNYYKKNRKEFNFLVEDNKPVGGKWSFDEMNRLKVPKDYTVPKLPSLTEHPEKEQIYKFIEDNFNDHPGN